LAPQSTNTCPCRINALRNRNEGYREREEDTWIGA